MNLLSDVNDQLDEDFNFQLSTLAVMSESEVKLLRKHVEFKGVESLNIRDSGNDDASMELLVSSILSGSPGSTATFSSAS